MKEINWRTSTWDEYEHSVRITIWIVFIILYGIAIYCAFN